MKQDFCVIYLKGGLVQDIQFNDTIKGIKVIDYDIDKEDHSAHILFKNEDGSISKEGCEMTSFGDPEHDFVIKIEGGLVNEIIANRLAEKDTLFIVKDYDTTDFIGSDSIIEESEIDKKEGFVKEVDGGYVYVSNKRAIFDDKFINIEEI